MMAVWACSGALLLVLLTGVSYSYPANKGFDAGSAYGSSNRENPASAGSSWEGPSSGYTDSGARAAAAKTRPQTASRKVPKYSQPGVQNKHQQDINWSGAPPSPFSSEERPSARRFASSKPEALGSSYVGPPAPPQFQAGELSHTETSHENGNYESETEERGIPPPPPGVAVADGPVPNGELPSVPRGGRVVYPYSIDYMFRMGRYPPGTLSHFTDSFEKGRDSWQDSHQIRYNYPAKPRTLQAETIPIDSGAPRRNKRPSRPVKQSAGSAGYGQTSAVKGQNQPYRRVGSSRMTQPKHG
ncbi:uncharacterized protein LOC117758424 [Hippoglossus hippoglossus]|uniref:uncharacterized protein LOC117758424 n=1 Tax=Hippoglossus hippoglossus TaxID=8267 RepID=UPI00148C1A9C|nr:uncharacterized protein LOC117758424 [Hippoglossus hippoglossus]